MTKTQDLGISQLPNGNWCYRFTKTVDGKRVNRKGSKDEAGNPLKTKRAAAQAKAIAEMRFEASLNQKPEHRMTFGEVYMEYCEQGRSGKAYSTIKKQNSLWKNHLEEKFGSRYVDSISVAEVNDYLSFLYYNEGRAYKYVEGFLKMFYLIFGQAYSRNYLDVDVYNKLCVNKDVRIRMPKMKIDEDTEIVAFSKEDTYEELKLIADLAQKYDTYVITDEVYEPNKHIYFASLPGMWERTISCSSLSKTYSITGWRLGYIIAPPHIIDVAKKVHDFLTVGAAAPLQEAAVTGLQFPDSYYQELQQKYTAKRDLFLKGLNDIGIAHTVPQGAYYILLDISEFGYESDQVFCEDLARLVGVGAVPGSSFFREPVNHLIRLHFAKKDETLYEALNRLADIRKKMPYQK